MELVLRDRAVVVHVVEFDAAAQPRRGLALLRAHLQARPAVLQAHLAVLVPVQILQDLLPGVLGGVGHVGLEDVLGVLRQLLDRDDAQALQPLARLASAQRAERREAVDAVPALVEVSYAAEARQVVPPVGRRGRVAELEGERGRAVVGGGVQALVDEAWRYQERLASAEVEDEARLPPVDGLVRLAVAEGALGSEAAGRHLRRPGEAPALRAVELEREGALAVLVHVGLRPGARRREPELRAAQDLAQVLLRAAQEGRQRLHELLDLLQQVLLPGPHVLAVVGALDAPVERRELGCQLRRGPARHLPLHPRLGLGHVGVGVRLGAVGRVFQAHVPGGEPLADAQARPLLAARRVVRVEGRADQAALHDHGHPLFHVLRELGGRGGAQAAGLEGRPGLAPRLRGPVPVVLRAHLGVELKRRGAGGRGAAEQPCRQGDFPGRRAHAGPVRAGGGPAAVGGASRGRRS
mmetsp:Transcript_97294/g.209761  ORF Transcript_97294/g.209761 Transcript_97294/m.209761 type:complete len:466 (-) Transcript_97294:48-1445(-)